MIKCSGKSVLKGIAIGRIYLYKKQEYVLKQETIENPEAEIERMEKAKETATEQLEELYPIVNQDGDQIRETVMKIVTTYHPK